MPGVEWAWLIPALSFFAFGIIVLIGRYLPGKGSFVAVLAIGGGFILFWFVLADLLGDGIEAPRLFEVSWFTVGDTSVHWGMIIDPLAVLMLGIVTFVALGIQVYSLEYMRGDPRYGWYFAVHALFAASMLSLVVADNLLLLYIAWELVGLCSYLLIGHWYERRSAAEAAKKAFVTTRIGDVALLIGILLLFKATGTFTLLGEGGIFAAVAGGQVGSGTLTVAALLIFLGAMGKSAQFPLHVWLPDAMEGPTPVSALIHAATMVVAGVFLVARIFPIFLADPTVLLIVAVIGLLTALIAATMALVMTDLKRILAYSTVSHLGFMMLALGAGPLGLTAALFHLLAHAMSKALLFLGAGAVTHATERTDVREMGGLARRMPLTAITFAVGALALAGIPPLSGFFSKDEILVSLFDGRNPVFFILFLGVAFLSALYMSRALFLVFWGPLKREHRHAHEAPLPMLLPMALMAVMAAGVGFLAFAWSTDYGGFGTFLFLPQEFIPGEFVPDAGPKEFHFNVALGVTSIVVAVAGFGFGWLLYGQRRLSPEAWQQRFAPLHRLLVNKYYLDDLYQWGINRVVLVFSGVVALFDRIVVNDGGVNGTSLSVMLSAFRLRYLQTGRFYNYALGMVLGVVAGALIWWLAIPGD